MPMISAKIPDPIIIDDAPIGMNKFMSKKYASIYATTKLIMNSTTDYSYSSITHFEIDMMSIGRIILYTTLLPLS